MDRLKWNMVTFGCKVNTYDSGLLQQRLKKARLGDSTESLANEFVAQEEAQVHLLNTCAVTQEATREALRVSRRLKSHYPNSYVVITGCAAQVDTEQFEKESAVDLVVANSHKSELEKLVEQLRTGRLEGKVFKSNIFKKEDLEAGGGLEDSRTRSFLKIQDGCNSFCTFCVIPFARGKSRSIGVEQLIEKVLTLESRGIQEVVLTGIHIGDYEDGSARLEDLVEALLKHTGIQRIRLGSLEPIELSNRLLDLYESPRMCKHFHMSIQAANTKVLHDMKRKYSAEDVEKALLAIKARYLDAFVGMDVIAGFVGESDAEFEDTYQRLKRLPWTRLHVFPYSERPGTYATRIEGKVPPPVLKLRAERLRELSLERFHMLALEQVGQVKKVLRLKSKREDVGLGLSRDFWHIQGDLQGEEGQWPVGEEFSVQILGFDSSQRHEGVLFGRLV